MTKEQVLIRFADRQTHGFASVVLENQPSGLNAKGKKMNIMKRQRFTVNLVDYAKRKAVKQGVESGEREAVKLPSWLRVTATHGKLVFTEHVSNKTPYLSMPYESKGDAEYFMNGERVKFEDIKQFYQPSKLKELEKPLAVRKLEAREKHQDLFMRPKLESIVSIT